MIYYYYGSKEELYIAVLERAYSSIRSAEDHARFATLPPVEAVTALVEASFDFHWKNPHVGVLISIENINGARFLERAPRTRSRSLGHRGLGPRPECGPTAGLFRHLSPPRPHAFVSSLCVFRVTNRAAFKADTLRHRLRRR